MPGHRHFAFTYNNWTQDGLDRIRLLGHEDQLAACGIRYIAFGFETCPTTGTPHLQGAIGFRTQKSLEQVRNLFNVPGIWLQPARQFLANYRYAIKEKHSGGLVEEYGDAPANAQGGRNDIEQFLGDVRSGMRLRAIRESHYSVYTRNTGAARELILQHLRCPDPDLHPLREWQADLLLRLQMAVDDRKIIFVVDPVGNGGKSWFASYYEWMRSNADDVLIMRPTKRDNMAYIFVDGLLERNIRTVFVDCSRQMCEHLNYTFLEELKDGRICSGKFVSRMVPFPRVHVVVLMNQDPDVSMLSGDRFDIIRI